MKIRNVDIIRVNALKCVAENMEKKDFIKYLEGYEQALRDYKCDDEESDCFKNLCDNLNKFRNRNVGGKNEKRK